MSLWTPGGEHEVPRDQPQQTPPPAAEPATSGAPGAPEIDEEALAAALGIPSLDELSDEERAQLEQAVVQMAETERQLATTPPEVVIANLSLIHI